MLSLFPNHSEYYRDMGDRDRASVDVALNSLEPILKTMARREFHFHKLAISFNITGPHGLLQVVVTDNPVRAIVKTVKKKGKSGSRF